VTIVPEIARAVDAAAAWATETGLPLAGAICCAGVGIGAKVHSFLLIRGSTS
jgi:hypothetical protein